MKRSLVQSLFFAAALVPGLLVGQDAATRKSSHEVRSQAQALQLATSYLGALYEADFNRLAELTTDDLLFTDETSAALPGGPWRYEGRDAVFGFFRGSVESVESSSFDIRTSFRSGDQVVLQLEYQSRGDGAPFGAPGTPLELRVEAVTVLELRGGRIAEHHDHVDYESLMAQVQEQIARSRATPERNEVPPAGSTGAAPDPDSRFPQPDPQEVASLRALADRYLRAVWALDYDTMEGLLAENALYEDYTAEYFGIDAYRFDGRDAVLDFFRTVNADSGTRSIVPTVRETFVAGPNVLVLVDVTVTVDGKDWGIPGRDLIGSGLTVTWLRMRDGRITRHVDFADFDTAIRDFERSAAGPAPER